MKKITNIIIANDAEAFSSVITNIKNDIQRTFKINKEHFLSGRFILWEGDNKIVITPLPIQESLIKQLEILDLKEVENWYPSKIDISLSGAIFQDKNLLKRLREVIKQNPGVILSPYSYTEDFKILVDFLRTRGLDFHIDQEPIKKSWWLTSYLGSKIGFRIEIQGLSAKNNIPVPRFFVCKNKKDLIEAAVWFFENKLPCVMKANNGEGGWGVLMIDHRHYNSLVSFKFSMQRLLDKDSIWDQGPFIIEDYILSNKNDQKSPSIEIFIENNKTPKITYICNQIVDSSGKFLGILMGKESVNKKVESEINHLAKVIATRYSNLGYRGFFDIDFILSKNGTPYPIETNARRTGGTHVFDLAKHIFGNNWSRKTICLSSDSFEYKGPILSAKSILDKISKIKFLANGKKIGVVITYVNEQSSVFGFIIFAPDKKNLMKFYYKLVQIFNK